MFPCWSRSESELSEWTLIAGIIVLNSIKVISGDLVVTGTDSSLVAALAHDAVTVSAPPTGPDSEGDGPYSDQCRDANEHDVHRGQTPVLRGALAVVENVASET